DLEQDPLDLVLLRQSDLADAIPEVEDLERFDEERLPACGLVVHHAAHLRPRLRADRHDVAAVALRDDRFLEERCELRRAEDLIEPLLKPGLRSAKIAAQRRQRRT